MGVSGQRTYWHLLGVPRVPSIYEIVSSKLLYYPEKGLAIRNPIAEWYTRFQDGSPLRADDWDRFADPRLTTYATYTSLQSESEAFLDGLERSDRAIPTREWIALLDRTLAPLRFPYHGLMMAAAYLGSMAPSGRIAIVCGFQAMDELRRVHRLAYRLRCVQIHDSTVGTSARKAWERSQELQPLRELVEQLLVTYDWGECFAALCLVIKPSLDHMALGGLAMRAEQSGDATLARMMRTLLDDTSWHSSWASALVAAAVEQRPSNREVLRLWIDAWSPRVDAACAALSSAFGEDSLDASRSARERLHEGLFASGAS